MNQNWGFAYIVCIFFMKNGEIAPRISVFGLKMANFQNSSKSFEIWLDIMEIQYWSKFLVIWVFFEGFIVILVTHFSLFFIKANIKEFLVPIFSKKCMQILNFGPNWLIFYRHHLWMVVQKCCVGKFEKIIFWPFFRP